MDPKAVIIGSGIAGLASAIRLSKKGFHVTVFEKNAYAGGKLSETRIGNFRFDTGPSLFTLPDLMEELFILCGEDFSANLPLLRIDPVCKYFYPDGSIINSCSDVNTFAKHLEEETGTPCGDLNGYLNSCKELYDLTAPVFIFRPFADLKTLFRKESWKVLMNLKKLNIFRTLHDFNSSFFNDKRVVQLFDRYATYNGSDPYRAPATLSMISHLEHNLGAYYPEKGMYSIIESLVKLAERNGVKFCFNTKVTAIEYDKGHVRSIKVNDETVSADIIVSDIDMINTYNLLKGIDVPEKYIRDRSSSAMIYYWCMNRQFPELDMHNIFFSGNYREEFKYLFDLKKIYSDPTIYIFISSKKVITDAPEGCENWFVMINAPENAGQDWESIKESTRDLIIKKISGTLKKDISQNIIKESVTDPLQIEAGTSSKGGSLYGNSSNDRMAAFYRHPNYSKKIRGLYFTGGSVHPGGGIPLCLASAKIVDSLIKQNY